MILHNAAIHDKLNTLRWPSVSISDQTAVHLRAPDRLNKRPETQVDGCMVSRMCLHAIYGLYLPDQSDVILYVGSWRMDGLAERLMQHQSGRCRTTVKMAIRNNVPLGDLRMRVLAHWMSGKYNPEGPITRALQRLGQAAWCHPHAFSTEEVTRGASLGGIAAASKNSSRMSAWNATPKAQIVRSLGGRVGAMKLHNQCGHEYFSEIYRRINHQRWHIARGIANPTCPLCQEMRQ